MCRRTNDFLCLFILQKNVFNLIIYMRRNNSLLMVVRTEMVLVGWWRVRNGKYFSSTLIATPVSLSREREFYRELAK